MDFSRLRPASLTKRHLADNRTIRGGCFLHFDRAEGAQHRSYDFHAKHRSAEANLIAVAQIDFAISSLRGLFGGLTLPSLADLATVDPSAIAAAEVANTNVRRVDVQQAMVTRDTPQLTVFDPRPAALGAANHTGRSLGEFKLLADPITFDYNKPDAAGHFTFLAAIGQADDAEDLG